MNTYDKEDSLKLLNVSGKYNNCFYNSVYLVIKDNDIFKKTTKSYNITNGTKLRKYLSENIIDRSTKNFIEYLKLAKTLLTMMNNGDTSMEIHDVASMLSVNVAELESLLNAGILDTNLESEAGIQNLLEKHLKVGSRMPSESERKMVLSYIQQAFNIIIVEIILGAKTGADNNQDKTLDTIYKYVYKKHKIKNLSQQSIDLILLKTMKEDIKIANIINKIKERIFSKIHNLLNNIRYPTEKLKFSVFINDMRHYQVLKINKKIINNYKELIEFILPKDNFTFSQKSIRSQPIMYSKLKKK